MLTLSPDFLPDYRRLYALAERHPRRAVQHARRALQHTAPADAPAYAQALATLGWTLFRWERFTESRTTLTQAHATFVRCGHQCSALHCRRVLLLIALFQGTGLALQADWSALATDYHAAHLPLDAARTHLYQIEHLNALVYPQTAAELVDQIAPLLQNVGTVADQGWLQRVQASIASDFGQLDQALAHINTAEQYFARMPSPIEVARCRLKRAWVYQRREQFDQAEADLEHATAIFQRLDLPLHQALCERNRGITMLLRGAYDQALARLVHAQNRLVSLGRQDVVADCDLSLGNVAYYLGQYELALARYRRAQVSYASLGSHYLALLSRRNQALALRASGQAAAARTILDELVAPVQAGGDMLELAEVVQAQAQVARTLHQNAAALTALQHAQTHFTTGGNLPAVGECLLEQGEVHLEQQAFPAAMACFQQARSLLVQRPIHRWRVDYGLGQCVQRQGDPATALTHYRDASATIAQLRQPLASEHASSGLFRQAQQLMHAALDLAATRQEAATVLTLAEQQRALALQRQMTRIAQHIPPELQARYVQQQADLQAQLATADISAAHRDALITEYTDLLLRIRHTTPVPPGLPPPCPDLDLLRPQLTAAYPDGWVILSYATSGADLLIVTIDAAEISVIRMPRDARFHTLVMQASTAAYRDYIYRDLPRQLDPKRPSWQGLTDLTVRLLPASVRARLHPALRLLIIPSEPLHMMPWAVLRWNDAWLCQQATIQILPALSLWSPPQRFSPETSAALVLGCSQFGSRAQPLPHASAELDLVAACWPGPVTCWHDAAATRSALQRATADGTLRQYRMLHITSHAQLVGTQGLLAHIKLWDGNLLHDEVARLTLDHALVVLSMCKGAVGEVLPGEEVLSLSHAFLAAGAYAVVASLWPVYDQAIQAVLIGFYTELARGVDAPAALAAAQRAYLQQKLDADDTGLADYAPLVVGGLLVTGIG
jgi:CHAT domain-containing protein